MARRDHDSEAPVSSSSDERRGRLEGVIPELIKKAVQGGFDKASDAQETIKSFISESKIPKEIAAAILQQVDETKNGLFRVVAKEVRGFLEAIDFQRELQKLLTTVSFEIKTEIRFVPNASASDGVGRPEVKAEVKVRRAEREERRRARREERSRQKPAVQETPAARSPESPPSHSDKPPS